MSFGDTGVCGPFEIYNLDCVNRFTKEIEMKINGKLLKWAVVFIVEAGA